MSDTKPILYLMSKYTGREADSLKENQDNWLALNQLGFDVYSPICETHNVEEFRKQQLSFKTDADFHYIQHLRYPEEPDYVARDLRLIYRLCIEPEYIYDKDEFDNPIKEINPNWKQPKIVGVVCPSALFTVDTIRKGHIIQDLKIMKDPQFSNGVADEFIFMQSLNILVIPLATALTVPFEQWREHAV